jgi:hypothetical protein
MKKIVSLSFLFLIVAFDGQAGGGWPQARRQGYAKLGQSAIQASNIYDASGNVIPITPSTGIFTTSLYGEYGITNRFTAILYLPFFVRTIQNELQYNQSGMVEEGDELNSFGDTDISFKYGLVVNKPIVVSATLLLGLPFGNSGGGKTGVLQTGDGEFNQMLRIDVSHSFYPRPLYTSAYTGFNNRTNGFSDEWRAGLELGYTVKQKLTLIAKLSVVQSLFNGSESVPSNGIFSNNTEYISPEIEVAYSCKPNWGISFSIGGALAARNILAAPNYGIGIFWKTGN